MFIRSVIAGLLACLLSTACLAQADLVTPRDVNDNAVPRMVPFCPVGTTGKYAACSPTNPLPVFGGSGSSTVVGSQEQDVRATGTLNAATLNQAITLALNGQGSVGFAFSGLTASGATLTYEQSNDGGTTWTGVNEVNAGTGVPAGTRTTDGQTRVSVSGRTGLRVRVSSVGTGTITVASNVSVREAIVTLGSPLPPGANIIGGISNPFALEATQQGVATSNAAISAATGTQADAASASGANTSVIGALRAIRDRLLGFLVALPPSILPVRTAVSVAASSTQLVPAKANRRAAQVACDGTSNVGVSQLGATLTANTLAGGADTVIPASAANAYVPPFATTSAITAYGTSTAQTCVVLEWIQ